MAKGRINKTNVDRLVCSVDKSMDVLWDDALRGFGVVVLPSGRKTFIVQCKRNGRSQKVKIGVFGPTTAEQARAQALNLLGAIEAGADPVAERRAARAVRTFRQVAEDFMAQHVLTKRKPRTAESYRCLLDKYVLPELGAKRIVEIGRADVARLHSNLGTTPRQANAAVSVISAIWGWAARREETEFGKNPATRLERFPERRWERYLSSEEMGRLGKALQRAETEGIPWMDEEPQSKHGVKPENRRSIFDPFAVAAIRLLILTGMRPREVLNLEWGHVDFERGALFLPDSKTGRKTVILGGPALRVLSELPRVEKCPFVIAGRSLEKPRADLNRPWVAVRRYAKLEGVRLYDLRHSFASVGAGASLGLPIVGKLLGHSQPATTNRYAHLDADPLRHAANAISTSIASALAGTPGKREHRSEKTD
ncbi:MULTISPECIES: site-specific integrase [Methylosinus]|nr:MULTISPECIES: site-specific integrase [Methylosinus]